MNDPDDLADPDSGSAAVPPPPQVVRAPGEGASPSPPEGWEGDRGVAGGDPIDASSRPPPPHRSAVFQPSGLAPPVGEGTLALQDDPPGGRPEPPGELLEASFGPQRPALHGVLRLALRVEGEKILACEPVVGFLHRGVEKLFEAHTYLENGAHTDRLDFVAAATSNLAYAGAVEKLHGIAVPRRARLLRTLLAELQRIASHLFWLGGHALDLGVLPPHLLCLREREHVLDLFESYCGARLTLDCMRPGGVAFEPPPGWQEECRSFAAGFPARLDACEEPLTENRLWKRRTVGLGVLSPETAIAYGVSGPMLRASGVEWDLRKALPYEAYAELDFEVPVGRNGDCYDRYLVRVAEMRQAVRIAGQCLDRLARLSRLPRLPDTGPEDRPAAADPPWPSPPGSPWAPPPLDPGTTDPAAAGTGPRPSLAPQPVRWPAPAGAEVYHAIEGPRGEIGFYIVAGAGEAPHRCHVRSPSLRHLQVLGELARGHRIADLVTLIGSADIALGEVDR
ncbi:MAG TPA: NADH-quinone oxidoreductase subunit D [Thermoanaerobaculia bacterium]|nr:NADH-quinone oxidoreductase subunit D [Thermoanaerobaculia bacterium]